MKLLTVIMIAYLLINAFEFIDKLVCMLNLNNVENAVTSLIFDG